LPTQPSSPRPRILLTGSTGQVGGELLTTLAHFGDNFEIIAPNRSTLDLADESSVRAAIRTIQPRWIVNPAAYTAVDKAESEPDLAYAINRDAVKAIGEEAQAIGAAVIHFSTDYVFDGLSTAPYLETDPTNPVSVYGASKLAGEQALAGSGAAHLILRTSWVYGPSGKNFLLTILKLARERDHLRIVGDQHGAPTWSRDLANLTAHLIQTFEREPPKADLSAAVRKAGGVYHCAGAGETTWYGFASEAVRLSAEAEPNVRFATLESITTAEYPTPAKRPANSRLNGNKLKHQFGWSMMDWNQSLREVLESIQ